MTFQQSIRVCLTKYADFTGTASRSEYWWFVLFLALGGAAASALGDAFGTVFLIAAILPLLAAGARRLHDYGTSGWLQLIGFVPVAGLVVLVVILAQERRTNPVANAAQA